MNSPKVKVVLLPSLLTPPDVADRSVAVFDVLRATTTLAAALHAGIAAVRIFPSPEAAADAAGHFHGGKLLAGERRCLPPPGFDRGNSPGAFTTADAGRTLFFATTNGTRALLAAAAAPQVIAAALVNAAAAAEKLLAAGNDICLLCAGTDGAPAMEDLIGCGAVLEAILARSRAECENDLARLSRRLFLAAKDNLLAVLRDAQGGRNVIAAGLPQDIEFAARLDAVPAVGILGQQLQIG